MPENEVVLKGIFSIAFEIAATMLFGSFFINER